jgi:hypothetical protein
MSQVYNYIPRDLILTVHNYSIKTEVKEFTNVTFRTEIANTLNFYTPIGMYEDKIISTTNKQLSFLLDIVGHFISTDYGVSLQNTYNNLITLENNNIIDEPVMQFIDYESVSGTGHSYDLMFYILYIFISNNIKAKLLVVKSENKHYNTTLDLIKKYYNIEYFYIEPNTNYTIKQFYCCQTYQNVLFNEVKEFINNTLIIPIIDKYIALDTIFYKYIYKIKINNKNNINGMFNSYEYTDLFTKFCSEYDYFNIDNLDEEYKIFLLNKSKNIIITWGSSFYININYYLLSTKNKFISVIFHPHISSDKKFITNIDNHYKQIMHSEYCGGFMDQYYNKLIFNGEVIESGILDEWLEKTKLLSI